MFYIHNISCAKYFIWKHEIKNLIKWGKGAVSPFFKYNNTFAITSASKFLSFGF